MPLAEVDNRAGKYVTFQLSRQYYAIRSDRVKQILPMSDVRQVPQTVPFLAGAVGCNGRLIPVVDLRERLASEVKPPRPSGSVLVVSLNSGCPLTLAGVIADKLSEVVNLKESEIRGNIAQMRIDGRPYGRPKTVIEVESLLQFEEWARIRSVLL